VRAALAAYSSSNCSISVSSLGTREIISAVYPASHASPISQFAETGKNQIRMRGNQAMAFGAKMQARSQIASQRAMHQCKHRDSDGAGSDVEPANQTGERHRGPQDPFRPV
jgi:hypothetical protein